MIKIYITRNIFSILLREQGSINSETNQTISISEMTDDDNSPAPEAEPGALEGSEGINVAGLISIIVFYLVVLLIGLWAGWRQRKVAKQQGRSSNDQEEVMLAGRDIGLFVGIMTMGGKYFLDDGALLTISLNFTIN